MGDRDLSISGTPGYEELAKDPARIIEIVKSDAAQLPRMEQQREGWGEIAALAEHVKNFLDGRVSERLKDNVAISVYSVNDHATSTADNADLFMTAATGNHKAFDHVIPEIEHLNELADQYSGEVSAIDEEIDVLPDDIAAEDRKAVTDVKAGLQDELRMRWFQANSQLVTAHGAVTYSPPAYDGAPEWQGPDPEVYPGWNGGGHGGGSAPGAPGHTVPGEPGHSIPVDRPGDWTNNPVEGPELQNPGSPSPAPAPGAPPVGTLPPPGGGAPPFVPGPIPPPAYPPGGSPPVTIKPTPGLPPGAKPTPGMPGGAKPTPGVPGGQRPGAGYSGKPGANQPSGGRTAPRGNTGPTGSKASRALLPNQRGGTASSTGVNPSQRPARPTTALGRTAQGTGQFGGRTRTTVPSVIGGRSGAAPGGAKPQAQKATPSNVGKVFGARANKGKTAKRNQPAPKRNGVLAKNGAAPQRDRSWVNAPKVRSGNAVLAGKVIGGRSTPQAALETTADKVVRARAAASRAKAVAEWRARRSALPEHELADGIDATVVPDVITAPWPNTDRMRRKDIGPVFGARGWENQRYRNG